MSDLENLVPPLELCKKIPAGEFKDSCFVRAKTFEGWVILLRDCVEKNKAYMTGFAIHPAPTLEELIITLADMTPYAVKICESFNEWHVECCIAVEYGERYLSADSSKNPATAALKLWLKMKGIEA